MNYKNEDCVWNKTQISYFVFTYEDKYEQNNINCQNVTTRN